jgi:membrane protease subunit HflK
LAFSLWFECLIFVSFREQEVIKIPLCVDHVTIVPTKRQLKQGFGFSTPGATDPYQNVNPSNNMRSFATSISPANNQREVAGDRTVDEVITIGRQEIEIEALRKMQSLSSKYVMGISIDQVQLKNINRPVPVQASFNEVNQAQQEKEKLINEARRDYNRIIPLAEGERDQRIREADGYRLKRINEAQGDGLRFNALFDEYRKAPEVTRRRIYLETMQEVMPTIKDKVIIDSEALGVIALLNLTPLKGEQIRGQQP